MIKKVFLSYEILIKMLQLPEDNVFVAYVQENEKGINLILIDPFDKIELNFVDKL